MSLRIGVIGTGIFATDNHLPTLQKLEEFTVTGAYNRTKAKAETFAQKAGLTEEKVYDLLEAIFTAEDVDVVDALLPVQFNTEVVKLAIKHNKPLAMEKPIAANLAQAREIVELSRTSKVPILVLEQFAYFKAVELVKSKLEQIGPVVAFEHLATGPFYPSNKYLATGWRAKPEHIGGFLSDGGVHQLALLTGILGNVKLVSAHTRQVREVSGADDILFLTLELVLGAIGSFNYGSAFGNTVKTNTLKVYGKNGLLVYDYSAGKKPLVTVWVGPDGENKKEAVTTEFDDPNNQEAEFANFAEAVKASDKTKLVVTPEMAFHHLAIVGAALESSKDGSAVAVETV